MFDVVVSSKTHAQPPSEEIIIPLNLIGLAMIADAPAAASDLVACMSVFAAILSPFLVAPEGATN